MKGVLFLISFLFWGISSSAQNLVINPGFEEHGEISGNGAGTDNLRGNRVKKWLSPTEGSPDYFVKGSDYLYNQYGKPTAHSGTAMAGVVLFGGKKEYREYLMGEFSAPLEAGVTYDFSISIALAEFCGTNIDGIGVYFSNEMVFEKKTSMALKSIPQLIIDSTDQKGLEGKWLTFTETYTAVGGEKFLTIGNFLSDKKTKSGNTANFNAGSLEYAYYYFDDVSLIPTGEEIIDTAIEIVNVIETPKSKDTLGIEAGKVLVVNNIYFEIDKAILKPESFPILDAIVAEMKNQPELKVEISGHTDSDGTAEHNFQLSKNRAKTVEEYFLSKGIEPSRIKSRGYGSTKPISTDKNKNRRVEFSFYETE